VWPRDFVCTDLAMSQADQDAQDAAERLIAESGRVTPMNGMLMAPTPERELEVVQLYESSDQAREDLQARAKLADASADLITPTGRAPHRDGVSKPGVVSAVAP
jgi:hypothetical protein